MIVTYGAYIKNDYKPVTGWGPKQSGGRRIHFGPLILGAALSAGLAVRMIAPGEPSTHAPEAAATALPVPHFSFQEFVPAASPESAEPAPEGDTLQPTPADPPDPRWTKVSVSRGDNLSLIFDRLGLGPDVLFDVMSSTEDAALLARIYPGQQLEFQIEDGRLDAIRYEPSLTESLDITRDGNGFSSRLTRIELETRVRHAEAVIRSSLFEAGQEAGLSDNLIMQLAAIYGWDIDFALDIREGDGFKVVYEERYKADKKVGEGPILAAEFTNRGRIVRAVRYTPPGRRPDYFAENGSSMRKAFLRTPLKFTRISSSFNLGRRHPILNTIRAHRGVDYAAPIGTPVRATGDGVVDFIGNKGGYGRAVVLRHGGTYSTLYGHLSSFAELRRGARVTQGQVIGYVGMSGLATGPHLHYEFRVNGVHRDPVTVSLPRAEGIPGDQMKRFEAAAAPLLAALDQPGVPADKVLAMSGAGGKATALP